jgi:two-component system response regulator NreC
MINILVADDHAIVRAGLRALIGAESDMDLVGEASSGTEAVELTREVKPDVLVLDVSMPDFDGIEVIKRIKPKFPKIFILILTIHEDEGLLKAALKAGASGYILKQAAEKELISAIRVILRGDIYVDPAMLRKLLIEERLKPKPETKGVAPLTPREIEVLKLIVQGYTNRQIGEELNISVRTAENHRSNLCDKLGLHNRVELVRYAREQSLIS